MSEFCGSLAAVADRFRKRRKWWIVLIWLFPAACGYQLVGETPLPGGVNRLAITVLDNRTAHSFLQSTITNALLDEFSRRRPNLIVSVGQAQAVLSGTILSLEAETATRVNSQTASQRRLAIHVSLSMTDKAGRLLWHEDDLRVEQNYTVSGNKTASDQNRRRAMEKAALRLAENVYERLTSSF